MSPRPARTAARLLLLVALAVPAACGSDAEPEGGSSARAVVDAHVAASRRYDLVASCELLVPARREEMAAFDGADADGYCTTATEEITASATPETRARTRALYTGAEVTRLEGPGTRFAIESADGSYREEVELTEVDGRWWIARIESDIDDHGPDGDHGDEAEGPGDDGATGGGDGAG